MVILSRLGSEHATWGLCPSVQPRGQLKRLTLRSYLLDWLNSYAQEFVETPQFLYFVYILVTDTANLMLTDALKV